MFYTKMINFTIIIACLAVIAAAQDAILTPSDPFSLQLKEQATYHQNYLVEIDPQQYHPEWSTVYAYQVASGHSVVELQFDIVHKQFPERQGHKLGKCRLEDGSKRWCKVNTQGIDIHHHLIKIKLDCVSDCLSNITIGFAHYQWNGDVVPFVKSKPLESIEAENTKPNGSSNQPALKMFGWMLLTLILVLLAIQFAVKVANKIDQKMQQQRINSLKTKRTPQQHRKKE